MKSAHKNTKATINYIGEMESLQEMELEKLDIYSRRLNLDPYLSSCTTINSKNIKYVNVRLKSKLLEEKKEKQWKIEAWVTFFRK
jgi:hypothetical protein